MDRTVSSTSSETVLFWDNCTLPLCYEAGFSQRGTLRIKQRYFEEENVNELSKILYYCISFFELLYQVP